MDTMEYSMSSNDSAERQSGLGIRRRLSALTSFPNPLSMISLTLPTLPISLTMPFGSSQGTAGREALPEAFMKGRKEIEDLQKCMVELQRLPGRTSTHWAKLRVLRETAAQCVIRVSSPDGFLCEEVLHYRERMEQSDQASITAERRLSDDFVKISSVIKAYMTEIASVMESFPAVYLFSKRYEHYKVKCERLAEHSKNKNTTNNGDNVNNNSMHATRKLQNNQAKKEDIRAKFQAAVSGSIAMINATLLKKDSFLQAIFYHFVLLDHDLSSPAVRSIHHMAKLAAARMHGLNTLNIKNPHPEPIAVMPEKQKRKEEPAAKNMIPATPNSREDAQEKRKKGSEKYDSEKEDSEQLIAAQQHSSNSNGNVNVSTNSNTNTTHVNTAHSANTNVSKKSKKRTKSVMTRVD